MKNNFVSLYCFLFCFLTFSQAHAFLGLHESAEIIPAGHYRVGVIPQFYVGSNPSDFYTGRENSSDFGAFLDMNLAPDVNARAVLGTGTTDFWAAGYVKWVPYPDYQNQPAIGLRGGLIYVREGNSNFYNTQITPIFSKKYETTSGVLTPYVGVPVTFVFEKTSNNFTALQMAIGTDWDFQKDSQVGVELNMDLAKTTTTLSLHLNLEFDETKGFKK
jgi:hypothetical protein